MISFKAPQTQEDADMTEICIDEIAFYNVTLDKWEVKRNFNLHRLTDLLPDEIPSDRFRIKKDKSGDAEIFIQVRGQELAMELAYCEGWVWLSELDVD